MRITREELYEQIWNEPATRLAQRYDVSSSYLARVCEGLNVPHPPRGYWARRAAGEKIPVPPLPPAGAGDPLSWEKGVAAMERLPRLELPPAQPKGKRKAAPPKRPAHHPLVTAWRGFLEEAASTDDGYMVPRKKNVLDAFVTKAMTRGAVQALDALFIELEMRGYRVQLSPGYAERPPIHVSPRRIRDEWERRKGDWEPKRATIAYVREAEIGLTLFEPMEHVKVRRKGENRYVRISDLPPMHRYAAQSPGEEDKTRDMPTGRFVLRAYSPRSDAPWQREWAESGPGELAGMATAIADALDEVAPIVVNAVEQADQRERERHAQFEAEERRRKARGRVEARQRARQAARDDLRAILKERTETYALEAFVAEVSRRAAGMSAGERADLEVRLQEARALIEGGDAVDRLLNWRLPGSFGAAGDDSDDGGAEQDAR